MMPASDVFRFDAVNHDYIVDGEVWPHITGMLEAEGWIDTRWYSEDSSERGRCVHHLTAEYDLGALDPVACQSRYKGWLLAHVEAMKKLRPKWTAIEEPLIHSRLRYGGRPDRLGIVFKRKTVYEGKSGAFEKSHPIQTALQAILAAAHDPLPARHWQRLAGYYTEKGRGKVEEFKEQSDFDEAERIIRKLCR